MLEIADHLRGRGHTPCEFLLVNQFEVKIKSKNFSFQGFPDPLMQGGNGEETLHAIGKKNKTGILTCQRIHAFQWRLGDRRLRDLVPCLESEKAC